MLLFVSSFSFFIVLLSAVFSILFLKVNKYIFRLQNTAQLFDILKEDRKMARKSRISLPSGKYNCIHERRYMDLDKLLNIKEEKDLKLILNYLHNEYYQNYNLKYTALKYYYACGSYRKVFWPCLKK